MTNTKHRKAREANCQTKEKKKEEKKSPKNDW